MAFKMNFLSVLLLASLIASIHSASFRMKRDDQDEEETTAAPTGAPNNTTEAPQGTTKPASSGINVGQWFPAIDSDNWMQGAQGFFNNIPSLLGFKQ